ncbi:MAG: zf-HC2 domain-containing protein [Acidimicrobiales bacterium]
MHRARRAHSLELLLDDQLDGRRTELVLAHLERCPECLALLEGLARLQQALGRRATASAG